MNFAVILFLFGCVIANVHSKPITDDSSEELNELMGGSEFAELKKYMQCGMMTIGQKVDEVEEFQAYIKEVNVTAEKIMSKLGTDQFDMVEFKETCNGIMIKVNKFLLSMRNEFATCADDDVMKIVDLVLDFVKEFGSFNCNLNEKELSYFDPDLKDEWAKCAEEVKPKASKCLVERESNSVSNINGSGEGNLKEQLCKVDFTATGTCVKNAVLECGEEQANGLNLVIDFMLKYLEKKLECSIDALGENTI